jgi:transposase
MQYIAYDVHKRYSWGRAEDETGRVLRQERIEHRPGAVQSFLAGLEPGSPVAVETVGNWYWMVDEIERAGFRPKLVNAGLAKVMMGQVNKTDKLDARGLNLLQRTGTLPTVWIPPAAVRDARELPRARMVLVGQRTQLKNRVHATLAKYGLPAPEVSDLFGVKGRRLLGGLLDQLPPHTAAVTRAILGQLDQLAQTIAEVDQRIAAAFHPTKEIELLRTLPGVGPILSVVLAAEIGDIARFPNAERFAAYTGTVATVHASGGKQWGGRTRRNCNVYLKWALVEAANATLLRPHQPSHRHVAALYQRIRARRGHGKAIVAVARHLAEAAYWVLIKDQAYRPPASSTRG